MEKAESERIVTAVEARMRSFEAAERSRDAKAMLSHFADVPEFIVYNDGVPMDRRALVAVITDTFPTLRSIEGGFSGLRVSVLAPDYALVGATFRETVVDGSGTAVKSRGAVSWLWRKTDGEWRIVYGQVDHRPDDGS